MPSHKANRYGSRCEEKARERYNLEKEHSSWYDARHANGIPVEIKSTNPDTGKFQIYEKYHRQLARHDGKYVFVVYRPHGTGVVTLKMKMVAHNDLPPKKWTQAGHEQRQTRRAYLKIEDVF